MYDYLVKIMLLAALAEIGMSLFEFETCHTQQCLQRVEKASRDILKIDWKPISLFPEEARRFTEKPKPAGVHGERSSQ